MQTTCLDLPTFPIRDAAAFFRALPESDAERPVPKGRTHRDYRIGHDLVRCFVGIADDKQLEKHGLDQQWKLLTSLFDAG